MSCFKVDCSKVASCRLESNPSYLLDVGVCLSTILIKAALLLQGNQERCSVNLLLPGRDEVAAVIALHLRQDNRMITARETLFELHNSNSNSNSVQSVESVESVESTHLHNLELLPGQPHISFDFIHSCLHHRALIASPGT